MQQGPHRQGDRSPAAGESTPLGLGSPRELIGSISLSPPADITRAAGCLSALQQDSMTAANTSHQTIRTAQHERAMRCDEQAASQLKSPHSFHGIVIGAAEMRIHHVHAAPQSKHETRDQPCSDSNPSSHPLQVVRDQSKAALYVIVKAGKHNHTGNPSHGTMQWHSRSSWRKICTQDGRWTG